MLCELIDCMCIEPIGPRRATAIRGYRPITARDGLRIGARISESLKDVAAGLQMHSVQSPDTDGAEPLVIEAFALFSGLRVYFWMAIVSSAPARARAPA